MNMMMSETEKNALFALIKSAVQILVPKAEVWLYGSYARNEQNQNSDVDLLILLDKHPITPQYKRQVMFALYDIEIEKGLIISPIVMSKQQWLYQHRTNPFYENLKHEAKLL